MQSKPLKFTLNNSQPLLRHQQALLTSAARIRVVLGGWGSGKTRSAALCFLANCIANPWTPEYQDDAPFSMVIGYTHKVLVDSAARELKSILPPQSTGFYTEKKSPDWTITLCNSHKILLRTVKGAIEGASAAGVWLDEAHMVSKKTYLNYQSRVRDPLARRHLCVVSGLPEDGWLRTTFEGHTNDPDRFLQMVSTYENTYLDPFVIRQFLASADAHNKTKYLDGQWMPKEGLCIHQYDPKIHLVKDRPPKGTLVDLAIDIGDKGTILFCARVRREFVDHTGRKTAGTGIQVVDEMLPSQLSVRQAMRAAKQRGWLIDPARSVVFTDPNTRRDEIDAIVQELSSEAQPITIVRKKRGDKAEQVEFGLSCVNAALRSADGVTGRLTFWSGLPREPRSVLSVITRYHRNPRTGKPIRDDQVDHAMDCCRYIITHYYPLTRGSSVVTKQRPTQTTGVQLDAQGRRI